MSDERRLMMWAAAVHSTLYLALVFTAGLVTHNETAWKLAAFATGSAYLTTLVKSYEMRGWIEPFRLPIARALFIVSLADGALAGVYLI